MMVYTTLINIRYPENTMIFFYMISQITTFNIIPTTTIENDMFEFSDSQPLNYNFNVMDIF